MLSCNGLLSFHHQEELHLGVEWGGMTTCAAAIWPPDARERRFRDRISPRKSLRCKLLEDTYFQRPSSSKAGLHTNAVALDLGDKWGGMTTGAVAIMPSDARVRPFTESFSPLKVIVSNHNDL